MSFSEQARMKDVAQHVFDGSGVSLVYHDGTIRNSKTYYRHWATEMLIPGWYILRYNQDKKITGVQWVTDVSDEFIALLFANTLLLDGLWQLLNFPA